MAYLLNLAQEYSFDFDFEIPPEAIIAIGIAVFLIIITYWKIFTKANKPGWAALIPIYNLVVLIEITGRPLWWILLILVPCVNIVIIVMLYIDLAKSFGKDTGFAVGLILLPIIFLPVLAFGDAEYQGPAYTQQQDITPMQ